MHSLFDIEKGQLWYHPIADRLFIWHPATFLMLPVLEREDGLKYFCRHPYDVNYEVQEKRGRLIYIGEFE